MSVEYEARAVAVIVGRKGAGIFDEHSTRVELDDEGAGEYLVLSQPVADDGKIRICGEEWPELRAAIDRMIEECRE